MISFILRNEPKRGNNEGEINQKSTDYIRGRGNLQKERIHLMSF